MTSLHEKKDALEKARQRYEDLADRSEQLIVDLSQAHEHGDAIGVAAQIGRLDIVSIVLGLFGLLLGIAAFVGFWMIRRAAIEAAKDEARRAINEKAAEMFDGVKSVRDAGQADPIIQIESVKVSDVLSNAEEVTED